MSADLEAEYAPPEPAPTAYLIPLAELARPPAPLPEEAVARLAAAARRRKLAQRRKLSASIARGRRVSPTDPPAPMPPEARPLPARAVPRVEVPDTAANRLKAIRGALRDLRGGAPVDPAEMEAPARLFPELYDAIRSGDRFTAELALVIAEAFLAIEAEKERTRRTGRETKNSQHPAARKPAKPISRKPAPTPALPETHKDEMIDEAAERCAMEKDPTVRLEVIKRTVKDIRAGIPADPVKRAECIRPFSTMYRLATERPDINQGEIFATAAAQLARHIAGKPRQTDPTISLHAPARPAARRTAPPAGPADHADDVI